MYRRLLPWHINKTKITIKSLKTRSQDQDFISVLNWNVHKNNHHYKWLNDFRVILDRYRVDLITFQEYKKICSRSIIDKESEFGYGFMPNIIYNEKESGLLNASKFDLLDHLSRLTPSLEPLIKTPKPLFVSTYRISRNQKLSVINIHMINFVKIEKFKEQLDQIREVAKNCNDRVLLMGDFNTWSKKRYKLLVDLADELCLKKVEFDPKVKLDHIFYRGLKLKSAKVLSKIKSSDHKPLLATFKVI